MCGVAAKKADRQAQGAARLPHIRSRSIEPAPDVIVELFQLAVELPANLHLTLTLALHTHPRLQLTAAYNPSPYNLSKLSSLVTCPYSATAKPDTDNNNQPSRWTSPIPCKNKLEAHAPRAAHQDNARHLVMVNRVLTLVSSAP